MEEVRAKTEEIMELLNQAIEKSRSVDQIGILTKDILSISSFTDLIAINASVEASRAGEAGKGFAVVAREIRHLADSCAETAGHIQEVSEVVTGAVDYLAGSARELADYLGQAILEQLERSVQSGRQYRDDAAYIERSMDPARWTAPSPVSPASPAAPGFWRRTWPELPPVWIRTRRLWGSCKNRWKCLRTCNMDKSAALVFRGRTFPCKAAALWEGLP